MTHTFDPWIENLMQTPPLIDEWQREQVGIKNDGPYRQGYQTIPLKENDEPLINLTSYGISNSEYYLDKYYDYLASGNTVLLTLLEQRLIWPFVWARKSLALRLQKADILLRKHDLFLRVISGWRHSATQEIVKAQADGRITKDHIDRLFASQSGLTPHSTGGAFDIQLYSLQTSEQLTQSSQDDEYGFYNLELLLGPTKEQEVKKKVRRILYHVLCNKDICFPENETFTIHPGEFWHFGYGDPLSCYLKQNPFAIYGPIEPPKDYRITSFS